MLISCVMMTSPPVSGGVALKSNHTPADSGSWIMLPSARPSLPRAVIWIGLHLFDPTDGVVATPVAPNTSTVASSALASIMSPSDVRSASALIVEAPGNM